MARSGLDVNARSRAGPRFAGPTCARDDAPSHRMVRLRGAAGVPEATLHRFRHSVATQLVGEGKILKAQARLGHRDPATTLRHYAHATPLDDLVIADEIDQRLNDCTNDPTAPAADMCQST